ncbi:hypothetical protein [Klebsiella quasipneumoniae]|uniref:hypothetical protein n=1 Tax=Klebsiella quasipneumoniae TaxID=1463165 RepID=UPI000DFED4D6|nr:hypothetical protein [Klebsiella quasipneumoniae]STR57688.1 Uncharacterised protein [Klebsiella pneumoniae]
MQSFSGGPYLPVVYGNRQFFKRGFRMDKAYDDYFDSLAEGEEALSFAEFCEAFS